MKITPIAANQNVISFPNGVEVFFSYKTPVAGYHPDKGYLRTKEYYSSTTSRHINKYLGALNYSQVEQETINNLTEVN